MKCISKKNSFDWFSCLVIGDHGGDSMKELSSAMFLYSKQQLLPQPSVEFKSVDQIDFVPTFAMLMGIPIPFSNIGAPITSLLQMPYTGSTSEFFNSMYETFAQMKTYIRTYSKTRKDYSPEVLEDLRPMDKAILQKYALFQEGAELGNEDLEDLLKNFVSYFKHVKEICHTNWVHFDFIMITLGIVASCLTLVLGLLIHAVLSRGLSDRTSQAWFNLTIFISIFSVIITVLGGIYNVGLFLTLGYVSLTLPLFVFCLTTLCVKKPVIPRKNTKPPTEAPKSFFLPFIFGLLIFLLHFSNSFVVSEDKICVFLFASILIAHCINNIQPRKIIENYKEKSETYIEFYRRKTVIVLFAILSAILLRFTLVNRRCREEQWWCHDIKEGTKAHPSQIAVVISLAILATFLYGINLLLKQAGNLAGYSASIQALRFIPALVAVLIGAHWFLGLAPSGFLSQLKTWQLILPAQVCFGLLCLGCVILYFKPLTFTMIMSDPSTDINPNIGVIPQIYQMIKTKYDGSVNKGPKQIVYGLATVYSALFLGFAMFVSINNN